MDLRPTGRETELARLAMAAFEAGTNPPAAATLTEACVVAAAAGRAATDRTHLLQRWASLLGSPSEEATVSFGVDGDRCRHVARAAAAEVLLVADGDAVAEIALADTVRTPQPTLFDFDACHVDLPRGWRDRARPHDVERARTAAIVLLAADCAGAAAAALDATVDRVMQRPMRGGVLGDLQVVRHRLADMAIAVTSCWDGVLDAAARIDRTRSTAEDRTRSTAEDRPDAAGPTRVEPAEDVRLAAIRAKAIAVDRGRRVTTDAVRLAGGIGILEDQPWQRWYRRVKAAEPLFGSPRDHRAELAAASLARFR